MFPKFVIFKFNVYPLFALSHQLPNLLVLKLSNLLVSADNPYFNIVKPQSFLFIYRSLPGENTNRSYFNFSSYCPLQILVLQTCNKNISKTFIASSFKHGQLIEDNDYYLIKIKHKLFYELLPFTNFGITNLKYILCTISLATSYVLHLFVPIFVKYQTISIALVRTGS